MTVRVPICASPPAKTPGRSVMSAPFATIVSRLLLRTPVSRSIQSSTGTWPIAGITVSQSIVKFEPSTGTGRRRPDASGSPSAIRWNSTPPTRPFFSMIFTGAA